jgi:hypothetical protein
MSPLQNKGAFVPASPLRVGHDVSSYSRLAFGIVYLDAGICDIIYAAFAPSAFPRSAP